MTANSRVIQYLDIYLDSFFRLTRGASYHDDTRDVLFQPMLVSNSFLINEPIKEDNLTRAPYFCSGF